MPITRKRRAETIADNSPDRNVKRQSARVKNNNVKYTGRNYKAYTSRKNKEKSNSDLKDFTEKITEEDQAGITLAETTIDKSPDRNVKRQSNRAKNNKNVLASTQKYYLSDIFYDKGRPSWAQTNSQSQKVYIIPRS
jgi:hypothetical protein